MSRSAPAKDGTYPTTCWECSTCCGALATVREGRVVDFGPNPEHPYSKGAFCIKGIRGAPGEALDEMAERLAAVRQAWGPEAIVGATSGAYFIRGLACRVRAIS